MIFFIQNQNKQAKQSKMNNKSKNKTDKQKQENMLPNERYWKKIKDCTGKLSEESRNFQKEKWILVINIQG